MKAFLFTLISIALALTAEAVWQHFHPLYTHAQLAAQGIVDTWESHATVTALLLIVLGITALCVGAALAFGGIALRRHLWLVLIAVIVAGSSQLATHVEFTQQVARATGQTFGSFYGLF